MKKILISFSILSIFVFFFTSCVDKSGKLTDTKDVHIRVWESYSNSSFIKKAGAEYTKTHPNVKIDYINMELDFTTGNISVDGPAGIGPDLFAAPHDKLGELVSKNLILPTENPQNVKSKVLQTCSKALTFKGTMYGYPMSAETYALFYNKKLIRESEVPKSWENLVSWTQDFNAKNYGKYGFVMDFYNSYYSIIFFTGNGNRLFGEDGTQENQPNLNTPAALKGIQFFQSLRDSLNLSKIELSTLTCDGLFSSGNTAMHISGLWNVKNFERAKIDFGVAPLPSLPGESTPCVSFSGTRGMFVSSHSKHPTEAADFAKFLISPEMQKIMVETTGLLPSTNITVNNKYSEGFIKQLEYSFPMPSIPSMGRFWSESGKALYYIWQGADVKSELDSCNNKVLGR